MYSRFPELNVSLICSLLLLHVHKKNKGDIITEDAFSSEDDGPWGARNPAAAGLQESERKPSECDRNNSKRYVIPKPVDYNGWC